MESKEGVIVREIICGGILTVLMLLLSNIFINNVGVLKVIMIIYSKHPQSFLFTLMEVLKLKN